MANPEKSGGAKLRDWDANLTGCSEEEIHQYFDSFLPDCGGLSYSIARWISDKDS